MFTLFQAKIHYYCREQYFCHMEAAADEGLKKFSNDSVLKFFRAYAMVLQGMTVQGDMSNFVLIKTLYIFEVCVSEKIVTVFIFRVN